MVILYLSLYIMQITSSKASNSNNWRAPHANGSNLQLPEVHGRDSQGPTEEGKKLAKNILFLPIFYSYPKLFHKMLYIQDHYLAKHLSKIKA